MEIFKMVAVDDYNPLIIYLTYEERQKNRLQKKTESGDDFLMLANRGKFLHCGDFLKSSSGKVIKIDCAKEKLLHITCEEPLTLIKVAYHLGNRHAKVQIQMSYIRVLADSVLEDMVMGIGAKVVRVYDVFNPEVGAYADHIRNKKSTATIHEFTDKNGN